MLSAHDVRAIWHDIDAPRHVPCTQVHQGDSEGRHVPGHFHYVFSDPVADREEATRTSLTPTSPVQSPAQGVQRNQESSLMITVGKRDGHFKIKLFFNNFFRSIDIEAIHEYEPKFSLLISRGKSDRVYEIWHVISNYTLGCHMSIFQK